MKKNIKKVFLLTTLVFLLVGLSALSAAETTDNDTVSTDTSIQTTSNTVDDTVSTNVVNTNTKSLKTSTSYSIDSSNYATYFNRSGFIGGIDDGDVIDITSDITPANGTTWTIDKAVTINGNGHIINLNTTSGSYYGNETGAAFIIVNSGSNTNINNIKFYNSQIILNNTHYVTISNSEITVSNQRIGQGIGILSIREGSSDVTVDGCTFSTTNNSGSSTLVLAGASYCTINNNTITGTGNVGNLLYLTTYNIGNVSINDIELNSYNDITNNILTGPSNSGLCYGITLTGHDNLIQNNEINVNGQGITTQWGYTDPATPEIGDNSDRYKGNYYINNTVNNGASFKATNNSTITNNTMTGNFISGVNSTIIGNTFEGTATIQDGTILANNTFDGQIIYQGTHTDLNSNNDEVTTSTKSIKADDAENEELSVTVTADNLTTLFRLSSTGDVTLYAGYFRRHSERTVYLDQSAIDAMGNINTIYLTCRLIEGIKVIGINNATIRGSLKLDQVNGAPNYTIANITFICDNTQANTYGLISSVANGPKKEAYGVIENCTFIADVSSLTSPGQSLLELDTEQVTGHDYLIFRNCNFNLTVPSNTIDWTSTTMPNLVPIKLTGNSSVIFENNNITINEELLDDETYSTIYGIVVSGNNTVFTNNNIYVSGEKYLYAIECYGSNNTFKNNTIVVNGVAYTAGIYITGSNMQDNTIEGNNITLISGYGHAGDYNEDSGYAVVIEDRLYYGGVYTDTTGSNIYNNKVINNNIKVSGNNTYAIEQFGGKNTTITGNNITSDGGNPTGIALTGVNTTITNNNIIIQAESNQTGQTVDYFPALSAGIHVQLSTDTLINNNTITVTNGIGINAVSYDKLNVTENNVKTTDEYAVALHSTTNSNVEYNTLNGVKKGDSSVLVDQGSDNVVQYNGFSEKDTNITITPVTGMIGDIINLEATVTAQDGSLVNGGNFVFKLNGKTIGRGVVANGVATLENVTITSAWAKEGTTITATYGGNDDYESSVAEPVNVTVTKRSATATLEQITGKAGETVTLSVKLTDDATNDSVNSGRVVFKLNGKTLKDADGNVIYATVENGIASIQYTIPEDYAAKDYTLSVVFGDSSYERVDSTTTLTVEKRVAKVEIDAITVKAGETVTLSAKVTDDVTSNPVNTGKVVFKLNGRTLKDTDGNVIYATVENGIASIQYTILETYSAKDYTLSAVFADKTYDRATGNTTLTVTKE
ncbi:beta strand repeat-containing protein [Methanosphaera sp.]